MRGGTDKCEVCWAKTDASKREWAEWRAACAVKEVRRSEPLPVDSCMRCQLPLGAQTQAAHDKRCLSKPFSCSCGLTYSNSRDLILHRGKYHHP